MAAGEFGSPKPTTPGLRCTLAEVTVCPTLSTLATGRYEAGATPREGRLAELATALLRRGHDPGTPAVALAVPGRIEVLGKHTDYAGGPSLVAATRQGLIAIAVRTGGEDLGVLDVGRDLEATIELQPRTGEPRPHWSDYFRVVATRLASLLTSSPGATIAFSSTLPPSAGLSSSSALVVTAFLALTNLEDLVDRDALRPVLPDIEAIAAFLGAAEAGGPFAGFAPGGGVGTRGGSQDHTAILGSETGRIGLWSYAPVRRLADLPMPDGHTFAIAASGVEASKAGSAKERYNRASDLAAAAADCWRQVSGRNDPHLAAAISAASGGAVEVRTAITEAPANRFPTRDLLDRFDHFTRECDLVRSSAKALELGRLGELGALVDDSQRLATELLGNQVTETRDLARLARELGAVAASAFGAGFGGSVWAMVRQSEAESFLEEWRQRYGATHPSRGPAARFLLTDSGPGAHLLG